MNEFAMLRPSLVYQFKFLRSLAWSVVCFTSFSTTVKDIDSLCRFFTAFRTWSWETSVTGHDSSESSLTPSQFGCSLLLDSLDGVNCVLASRWAVALDLSRSFYHIEHLRRSTHCSLVFMRVDVLKAGLASEITCGNGNLHQHVG